MELDVFAKVQYDIHMKWNITHGESQTYFYSRWIQIVRRCRHTKSKDYKRYGGRGIKILWKDYLDFKKDMYASFLKMSNRIGKSNTQIDRIDVNGHYSKKNCKWSTPKQQGNNRRNNCRIVYRGQTKTVSQWAEITGIGKGTIAYRLKAGLPPNKIIEMPVSHGNKYAGNI